MTDQFLLWLTNKGIILLILLANSVTIPIFAQAYYPSRNLIVDGPGEIDGINYVCIGYGEPASEIWAVVARDDYAIKKYSGQIIVPSDVSGRMMYDTDFLNSNYTPKDKSFHVDGVWNYAFSGNDDLVTVDLENIGTAFWGYRIFENCHNLTTVKLPEGMTTLSNTFSKCSSLETVNIPSTVTDLNYTFQKCESLCQIEIPSSVEHMDGTFEGCTNLRKIDISDGVKILDGNVFKDCAQLTNINLPNSITEIRGSSVFENCSSLKSLILPRQVKQLRSAVFRGCSNLEYILIPEVLSIGNYAFEGCSSLKNIRIKATDPPKGGNGLKMGFPENVYKNAVLRVPLGSLNSYKAAFPWRNFFNVVENEQENYIEYGDFELRFNEEKNGLIIQNCNNPDILDFSIPDVLEVDGVEYPIVDIDHYAFQNSPNIESLTLPEFLTHFCDNTLALINTLKNLWVYFKDLPEGGGKEGCHVSAGFADAPSHNRYNSNTTESSSIFESVILHVPQGQASKYKEHKYWGQFKHIIDDNIAELQNIKCEITDEQSAFYDLTGRKINPQSYKGLVIEVSEGYVRKKILR
ncbi:MAG: leucine-rich repeat domain-containing protein [Muribaculaceae bacterium]|nr:leucine-rich repeat domain-containing protein [Muribaculaceae bacterium]